MKQVPTNVTLHSVASLSNADLSVFDSVDEGVIDDYAVCNIWTFNDAVFINSVQTSKNMRFLVTKNFRQNRA